MATTQHDIQKVYLETQKLLRLVRQGVLVQDVDLALRVIELKQKINELAALQIGSE